MFLRYHELPEIYLLLVKVFRIKRPFFWVPWSRYFVFEEVLIYSGIFPLFFYANLSLDNLLNPLVHLYNTPHFNCAFGTSIEAFVANMSLDSKVTSGMDELEIVLLSWILSIDAYNFSPTHGDGLVNHYESSLA